MKVTNEIDANDYIDHIREGKIQKGARQLIVSNGDTYKETMIEIKEFTGNEWQIIGTIAVNGDTLVKAVHNAMND